MKSLRPILVTALLLAVAACGQKADKPAAPPAVAAETVGLNAEIDNDVQQKSVADPSFRGAVLRGEVRYADDILTAADSRLLVRLKDQSGLTVGPNARISIDRFVIDTDAGVPGAAVSVAKGAFRFASSGKGSRPDGVRFNTPLAAIGIRGTVLEGVVGPDALSVIGAGPWLTILNIDPETATVIVLREGIIEVRFGDETVVLDQPGEAIALGGARRSTVFQIAAPASGRLDALLAPRGVGSRPPTSPPAGLPPKADGETTPPAGGKPKSPPRRDPSSAPSDADYSHDNEGVVRPGEAGDGRPGLPRSDGSVIEPRQPAPRPRPAYGAPLPRRDESGPGTPSFDIPIPKIAPPPARNPAPRPAPQKPTDLKQPSPQAAKDQPPTPREPSR